MEHMAWKGRIKHGCKAEYQRRHAEIWPEMVKVLKEAGICNYSIFYTALSYPYWIRFHPESQGHLP